MLPEGYEKKSFYRFDVDIDVATLVDEYLSISEEEWLASYWGNVHCSIGMLLLRGGDSGTSVDFFADEIFDAEILNSVPYMKYLIDEKGPFGGARYAFLFRMEADGVTLKHRDLMEQWKDLYRIHVPITTNEDAFLVAKNRSMHFAKGFAWSFDNFSDHGVVNGNEERVHLIFDVPYSEVMKKQIDNATYLKGEEDIEHIRRIGDKSQSVLSYPGDDQIRDSVIHLTARGLDDVRIADLFNQKKIPLKHQYRASWNAEIIAEFRK